MNFYPVTMVPSNVPEHLKQMFEQLSRAFWFGGANRNETNKREARERSDEFEREFSWASGYGANMPMDLELALVNE